jgi:hypothetical protein
MTTFTARLQAAHACNGSRLLLGVAPMIDKLPAAVAKIDDPFLPLGKLIINATRDLVCGYVFHLANYLSIGAAGIVALERTLAYVPQGLLRVIHGPFVGPDYVRGAYEDALDAHAVTLLPQSAADIAPYVAEPSHGAFVPPESEALAATYPHSVGVYRAESPTHARISVPGLPDTHWVWGETVYKTRTIEFEDALRAALEALRAL